MLVKKRVDLEELEGNAALEIMKYSSTHCSVRFVQRQNFLEACRLLTNGRMYLVLDCVPLFEHVTIVFEIFPTQISTSLNDARPNHPDHSYVFTLFY